MDADPINPGKQVNNKNANIKTKTTKDSTPKTIQDINLLEIQTLKIGIGLILIDNYNNDKKTLKGQFDKYINDQIYALNNQVNNGYYLHRNYVSPSID